MKTKQKSLLSLLMICSIVSLFAFEQSQTSTAYTFDTQVHTEYISTDTSLQRVMGPYLDASELSVNTAYIFPDLPSIDGTDLTHEQTSVRVYDFTHHISESESSDVFEVYPDIVNVEIPITFEQGDPEDFLTHPDWNLHVLIKTYLIPETTDYTSSIDSVILSFQNLMNGELINSGPIPITLTERFSWGQYDFEMTIDPSNFPNWDTNYPLIADAEDLNSYISITFTFTTPYPQYMNDVYVQIDSQTHAQPSEADLRVGADRFVDLDLHEGILYSDAHLSSPFILSGVSSSYFGKIEIIQEFSYDFMLEVGSSTFLMKDLGVDLGTYLTHSLSMSDFAYESEIEKIYLNSLESTSNHFNPDLELADGSTISIAIILSWDNKLPLPLEREAWNQITSNPTTQDNTIEFQEVFQASESHRSWSFQSDLEILSLLSNTSTQPILEEGFYIIDDFLFEDEYIEVNYTINPNFHVSYSILKAGDLATTYQISYHADCEIQNVDLVVVMDKYYQNWDMGTQDEDKYLTIENLDFTTEDQNIVLEGSIPDPTGVSFDSFDFDFSQVFDPSGSIIQIHGNLEIIDSNFAHYLEYVGETWQIEGIFTQDNDLIELNDQNIFFNTTDLSNAYLSFQANPILEYQISQSEDFVNLTITTDLNLTGIRILYYVENVENNIQNQDENAEFMGDDGSATWYYQEFDLQSGANTFLIPIAIQEPSDWMIYILIFVAIGLVAYGISKIDKSKIKAFFESHFRRDRK